MSENSPAVRISAPTPKDLPQRRLLIVRELNDFTVGGTMHWSPELLGTFMAWSDFDAGVPGVYRMAFVSETLATEQVKSPTEYSFDDALKTWNKSLPEERRLKLIVNYGNTASTHLGGRYRHDGTDRIGIIKFFTSEFFGRISGRNSLDRKLGEWHEILERSLQSHYITVTNWMPHGKHPEDWLNAGFVHQGDPYRHIVMLDRAPNGDVEYKCLPVSRTGAQAKCQ